MFDDDLEQGFSTLSPHDETAIFDEVTEGFLKLD
jgi:hypothetical protein